MALANNPLLAALTAAKAQKASASTSVKAPDPVKDKTSSFSSVFAKQAAPKPSSVDDTPAKPASAKSSAVDKKDSVSHSSAAPDKTVADSGNGLPAKTVNGKDNNDAGSSASDDDDDDTEDDTTSTADASADATLADTPVTDPALDPTLAKNGVDGVFSADPALDPTLVVTPPVQDPAPPVVASQIVVDPATLLSNSGATVVPPPVVQAPTDATDDKFDPSADPLEGLTAVQVALESKAQQNTQATGHSNEAGKTSGKQDPNADPAQLLAGNLAAAGDQPVDKSTTEGGGDKAFSGLLADGLKDVKGATSDTRVDNFAERLAALSQAAQTKTSAANPAPAPLMNQPLAMRRIFNWNRPSWDASTFASIWRRTSKPK